MMTRKDLMERWGVSERTIDRWVKNKGVPHVKSPLNGRMYFNEEDIKRWETRMMPGKVD